MINDTAFSICDYIAVIPTGAARRATFTLLLAVWSGIHEVIIWIKLIVDFQFEKRWPPPLPCM
jgi:hypothetical protein